MPKPAGKSKQSKLPKTPDQRIYPKGRAAIGKKKPVNVKKRKEKIQAERDYPTDTHVSSQIELGAIIKASLPTIRRYIMLGMPCDENGYNVEECIKWVKEFREKQQKEAGRRLPPYDKSSPPEELELKTLKMDIGLKKTKAEIKKLIQEARGRKLKNDEHESLLLPADDVRQWINEKFLRIKQRLELLPDELQMLAPAALRPQLRMDLVAAIHELLLEMSGWKSQASKQEFENAG